MKRIIMMLALTALLVVALSMSALSAFASPPPCTPGAPGCKTEPTKGNKTETQRGSLSAPGTESTATCRNHGGHTTAGDCPGGG